MQTNAHAEPQRGGAHSSSLRVRFFAVLVFLALTACLLVVPTGRAQGTLPEYQVKAAYLFNFLKFVEWPADTFTDSLAPIVIGIVGEDPFGDSLPQVIVGKTVQGRDLVIRKYGAGENVRGCHILFINILDKKKLPQLLVSLRRASVLTVSDVDGFLDAGGMIQFLSEDSHGRFAINVDAATQAKLRISSKLLSLARAPGANPKDASK